MRLKLLAFFLLWVTTGNAQQTATACLHDGYLAENGTCLCRDTLFTGTYCQNRKIYNDGVLRLFPNGTYSEKLPPQSQPFDIGVTCPPGFIGANCQPTKCVAGQSQAFYSGPDDQMVSFYITYNLNMRGKADVSTDDVIGAICQGFVNSGTSQLLYYTPEMGRIVYKDKTYDQCVQSFQSNLGDKCVDYPDDSDYPEPADCPSSTSLNFDLLNELLDKTKPNSELYLVTNYPANETNVRIPIIIRKAISRRIRINVYAFPAPYVMSENDYVNSPGYQALRTIAESTLGIFATPYSGVRMNPLGTNIVSESISAMMNLRAQGFVPTRVFSSATAGLQQVRVASNASGSFDYYISIRTEDTPSNDGVYSTIGWISPPDGWNKTAQIDTGNWKLYKMNTSSLVLFFSQDTTALNKPVDWVLYTKTASTLFTAVSNDVNRIDASSPYQNIQSGAQTLVGAVPNGQRYVTSASTYSPAFTVPGNTAGSAVLNSAPGNRTNCQFSSTLGSINCAGEGTVFLQTNYGDGTWSVSPFFCTGNASSQQTEFVAEFEVADDSTDELLEVLDEANSVTCMNDTASPLDEQTAERAFAIVSRNVRYTVAGKPLQGENYSPVDRLYWNPGNIFEYLNDRSSYYSYFLANLVTNTSLPPSSLVAATDYPTFKNNLMATTNAAVTNNNSAINWYNALRDTVAQLVSNPTFKPQPAYSDIFVVIDMDDISYFNQSDNLYSLFADLYQTRSRIYFLAVNSSVNSGFAPDGINDNDVTRLSTIAAQTGGGLYNFNGFDDLMQFFNLYFDQTGNGLFGADVVYQKMYDTPYVRTLQTGNITFPATLLNDSVTYWLHLYATAKIYSSTSSCNASLNLTSYVWGQQQRYQILGVDGSPCDFSITFMPPYSLGTSFIIYAVGTNATLLSLSSSIAFTDNKYNELASDSKHAALLQFGLQQPQYPVLSAGIPVTFAINNPNQEIYSTEDFNSTDCGYFPHRVDYDFRCSAANSFYFFYTTFNDGGGHIHTRTYVTRCLSQSSDSCANGVPDGGNCICYPGFSGTACNERICQNEGLPLPSGLCNCTTDFTGEFCEKATLPCQYSPPIPDTRSEVTSVMFVVDTTVGLKSLTNLTSPATLPGTQLTVVQYDCNGVDTVLLGTDPSKLNDALTVDTNCAEPTNTFLPDAILTALNSQVSPRALLVLVTSGGSPFGTRQNEILARLAPQRIDIRIFASNGSDPDLQFLTTLGNGAVFEGVATDFAAYYNNYVWNVVPRSLQLTSAVIPQIPRLSVVQTGVANGNFEMALVKDPADTSTTYTVYYIHTLKSANITVTTGGTPLTTEIAGSKNKITSIMYGGSQVNLKISITGSTPYSIEKMTTVLLGYGFTSNGTFENLNMGLTTGDDNYLSFYTSRSKLFDSMDTDFPYVTLSEIVNSTTAIGLPVNYPVSRKMNQSCIYNYYSIPIQCSDTTTGFVAQFVTYTTDSQKRLEQKIILCADSGDYTTPSPPTTTPGTTTPGTTKGPPIMSFAFIIDTRGGDPNLFAMTNETVNAFLQVYNETESIFLTDQQGNGTKTFVSNNPANIKQAFDVFARQRMELGDNNFTDLTPAFTAIQQAALSDNYVIQEMFFLTQTGVYAADSSALGSFQSATLRTVQYIAALSTEETDNIGTSIKKWLVSPNPGWDLSVANNTKDAMRYLVIGAPTPTVFTRAPIPTPRQYACVKKAQTSIFLSYETSKLDGTGIDGAVLNKTYFEFLQQFPSDFELGDTYNNTYYPNNANDKDFCNVNTRRFDAQTLMSGWAFSDQKLGTPNAMLCYNNFPGIRDYISMPSRAKSTFPNWPIVSAYINLTLSNSCKCSRLADNNTLKAVVWLSFSEPDAVTFDYTEIITTLTQTNYVHIILAFGQAADEGDDGFYHQLAQKSMAIAANYGYKDNKIEDFYKVADGIDTNNLVSFVYGTICKLQKIEGTTTPTGGNSEYFEKFWRAAAFYPEMVRGEILGKDD